MSETNNEIKSEQSQSSQNAAESAPSAEKPSQEAKPKHSNLFTRVITSVIGVPLIICAIFFFNHWLWAAVAFIAAFLGVQEWIKMQAPSESKAVYAVSSLTALIPSLTAYLFVGENAPITSASFSGSLALCAGIAVTLWITFLFNIFRNRNIENVRQVIGSTLSGAIYVGFTFLFLALFKREYPENAPVWIFMFMAMTWLSDTGAYFTGKRFGKHKLAPVLSPKKTIEGTVGGFVYSFITALIFKLIAFPEMSFLQLIILVAVANFLAQTGDLAESLIKRSSGVKDSGTLIPGHGGMLDRVDAILFSAPWVFFFATFTNYAF